MGIVGTGHMTAVRFAAGLLLGAVPLIAAPPGDAQFVFDPPINFSFEFEVWPTSVGLGHLDADGLLDAVVAGRNIQGLAPVMMGDAESIFARTSARRSSTATTSSASTMRH